MIAQKPSISKVSSWYHRLRVFHLGMGHSASFFYFTKCARRLELRILECKSSIVSHKKLLGERVKLKILCLPWNGRVHAWADRNSISELFLPVHAGIFSRLFCREISRKWMASECSPSTHPVWVFFFRTRGVYISLNIGLGCIYTLEDASNWIVAVDWARSKNLNYFFLLGFPLLLPVHFIHNKKVTLYNGPKTIFSIIRPHWQ